MSIESVMPTSHLILCCPLLLPSILPSIRVFSNESVLSIRCQSIGASALASVLLINILDWFPLGWTGWSPFSPRDSQESSPTPQFKGINSLTLTFLYGRNLTSIHDYWKNHSFDWRIFVGKVMSLLFNMLCWFVIGFLSRSKCLLVSWLQSPSAVIFEPKKIKSVTVSIVSPSISHEVMGPDAMTFIF